MAARGLTFLMISKKLLKFGTNENLIIISRYWEQHIKNKQHCLINKGSLLSNYTDLLALPSLNKTFL